MKVKFNWDSARSPISCVLCPQGRLRWLYTDCAAYEVENIYCLALPRGPLPPVASWRSGRGHTRHLLAVLTFRLARGRGPDLVPGGFRRSRGPPAFPTASVGRSRSQRSATGVVSRVTCPPVVAGTSLPSSAAIWDSSEGVLRLSGETWKEKQIHVSPMHQAAKYPKPRTA